MVVEGCEAGPVPRPLVAFTVHVYDLPDVNPLTVTGPVRADFERVTPPFLDVHVAVYFVIGEPLFLAAANPTFNTPLATRAICATVTAAGAPTVTDEDITDGGPSTNPFSAVTVNVYVAPFTKPDTTVVVP
jgi:hypothetical protein